MEMHLYRGWLFLKLRINCGLWVRLPLNLSAPSLTLFPFHCISHLVSVCIMYLGICVSAFVSRFWFQVIVINKYYFRIINHVNGNFQVEFFMLQIQKDHVGLTGSHMFLMTRRFLLTVSTAEYNT